MSFAANKKYCRSLCSRISAIRVVLGMLIMLFMFIPQRTRSQLNIVKAEYFYDNENRFRNDIAIDVVAGSKKTAASFTPTLSNLITITHAIDPESGDENSSKSPLNQFGFDVLAMPPPGNTLNFDGSNDHVSIAHNILLKPSSQITIEAWIRPVNIHTNQYYEIYRKEDGTARHLFSFQEFGTILSFGLQVGGIYTELDVPITASNYEGRWVHVAATFDGTVKRIFRNGELIGTENISGSIGTSGTAPAIIGSFSGSSEFFNGSID